MFLAAPSTFPALIKGRVETLQVNLGRLCNQACRHCHVDSSPARTGAHENAQSGLSDSILRLLAQHPELATVDLTGGAPKLNPNFRRLVRETRALGRAVLVRHNLTVQFEAGGRVICLSSLPNTACSCSVRCLAIRPRTWPGSAVRASSRRASKHC